MCDSGKYILYRSYDYIIWRLKIQFYVFYFMFSSEM